MSYQEYAQLGKGNNSTTIATTVTTAPTTNPTWQSDSSMRQPSRGRSETLDSTERPYVGSHISFSAPRRLPFSTTNVTATATTNTAPNSTGPRPAGKISDHSPSSSTSSTSLSPSNSASQKGLRPKGGGGGGGGGGKRRGDAARAESNGLTLAQLRELEAAGGTGGIPGGYGKKPDLVDVPLPWRPVYLQRRILGMFGTLFVLLVVTLEGVLDLSNRASGLGPVDGAGGTKAARYLWQLAPTAVMTTVAGMWCRVEFQAKSSAPWLRLSRGPADAERSLLLDYVSAVQPAALVRALRNRDFIVACAVAVSMLLRASVVASTALVAPAFLTVTDGNAQIALHGRFADDASVLLGRRAASLSLFTVAGLQQQQGRQVGGRDMSYPDGLASRFAYQRFGPDVLPPGSQLSATVDGFFPNLTCEVAQLSLGGVQGSRLEQQFNATFSTPGCAVTMPIAGKGLARQGNNETVHFTRFGRGGCSSSTAAEDRRIVIIFGITSVDANATQSTSTVPINGTIPRSTQLLCRPGFDIMRMEVVKNGSGLVRAQLTSPLQATSLSNVRPWDVAAAVFDSYQDNSIAADYADSAFPGFTERVMVDPAMHFALGLRLKETGTVFSPNAYFDASILAGLATDYFQHHAAVLAHEALLRPSAAAGSAPPVVTGTSVVKGDRLVARAVAVHFVVGFLALSTALTAALVLLVPTWGFLPRDPGSLIDTAALLGHSKPLLQALRGAGGADAPTLWARLGMAYFYTGVEPYEQGYASGKGYFKILGGPMPKIAGRLEYAESRRPWSHPVGMHPWMRILCLVIVAGMIAALEVALRASDANDGLVTVGDGAMAHLAWTVLPALLVYFVVIYLGLVDFTLRALAPFAELARLGSYRTMTLNFLDRTTPSVIYEAVLTRNAGVLFSTISLLLASLLTIFVGSLFFASAVPAIVAVQVQTQDFFETGSSARPVGGLESRWDAAVAASVVLDANVTYPPFTYEDLVFPRLAVLAGTISNDTTIAAMVPAVRPSMACRVFSFSDLKVNLTNNYRIGRLFNPLRIDIPGIPPAGNTEELASSLTIATAQGVSPPSSTRIAVERNALFGAGRYIPAGGGGANNGSGTWVYAWGQLENANTSQAAVKSVFALACNETVQRVSVRATFRGASMVVDASRPPVPIEETARESGVVIPMGNYNINANNNSNNNSLSSDYTGLINITSPHLLDGFFSSLVSSRFAIPVDMLGSTDRGVAEAVAGAVVFQHKVIRAQAINAWDRRPAAGIVAASGSGNPGPAGAAIEADSSRGGPAPAPVAFPASLQAAAGSVAGPRRLRLRQDPIPTRILQGLLASVLACAAAAWLLFPARTDAILPRLRDSPFSIAGAAALLADGNVFGLLGRGAEWKARDELEGMFRDGLHVTMRFRLGWGEVRGRNRRRREEVLASRSWGGGSDVHGGAARTGGDGEKVEEAFGISAVRTGGWGGGENVGLGLQARVGYTQRKFVRDWGWKN